MDRNWIFIEVFTIWGAIIKVLLLRTNWSQFLSKLNHEVHHLYVLRDTTMNCCLLAWVQGILFRKFGFNFWVQFYFLIVFQTVSLSWLTRFNSWVLWWKLYILPFFISNCEWNILLPQHKQQWKSVYIIFEPWTLWWTRE